MYQHITEAENMFGYNREGERSSLTLPTRTLSPRWHSLGLRKSFSAHDLSSKRNGEQVSEHLASQAVRQCQWSMFLSHSTQLINHEVPDEVVRKGWESGREISQRALKGADPINCITNSVKTPTLKPVGMHSTCVLPTDPWVHLSSNALHASPSNTFT